jgi:hypothetical protein
MTNKKKRSKCKAPQRKSTRKCKRTQKYGGEHYDDDSIEGNNTALIDSTVEKGKPVVASSVDASIASTVEQGKPVVASSVDASIASTVEQGKPVVASSVDASIASTVEQWKPVVASSVDASIASTVEQGKPVVVSSADVSITSSVEQGKPVVASRVDAPDANSVPSINHVASTATVEEGTLAASSVQVSDASSMSSASTASTITSAVEKGKAIASSEKVLDALTTSLNINIDASVSTVEQGIHSAASSENMNDASCAYPIDVPTPVMLSTPSLTQEKLTSTPSCRGNTPENVLRKSCLKKPLNLQLELELAEQELAASFAAESAHQPEPTLDFPDSVITVDQQIVKEINFLKEDFQSYDDDLLILCGLHDLYHISPYGFECFRQIFDGVYQHVVVSACFNEECYGFEKERNRERERVTQVLIDEKQKREALHQLLLKEQMKNKKLSTDCDTLQQQLFQKAQQQKISNDLIQNDNTYRRAVQRLEEVIQDLEKERVDNLEQLKRQKDEIMVIRENMSDLMTENTVLKNAAKQKKQQFLNSDTQTDILEQCYSVRVQTEGCAEDVQAIVVMIKS